jgi:thermostable 8-oxoguanine DNA glycosylase
MMTTHPTKETKTTSYEEVINYKQLDREARLHCVHPCDFNNRPTLYEEIESDTENLIQNVIRPYLDAGCVNLTEEELRSECRVKIAYLFHNEKHIDIVSRYEFFKYLKTALNNHVKGQVQRNRFTLKRTGIRPPEKGDFLAEHHKPIEISVDDPQSHIQVPEQGDDFGLCIELINDIQSILTPMECLVMNQLSTPNPTAVLCAKSEMWGDMAKYGRNSNLKVNHSHMAYGLGMSVEQFLEIRKQIQTKLRNFMSTSNEDYSWNASVAFLSKVFAVEVPRSTDKVVVRRLFSLAARNMINKINEEVRHHLSTVGARLPVDQGLTLSCFGIMFEDQNQKCMGCGVKSACVVETRSLGLDKITPHPSILGSRTNRVPAVNIDVPLHELSGQTASRALPAIPVDDTVNERSIEITNFLNANFKRAEQARKDNSQEKIISYALKQGSKSPILWMSKNSDDGELSLRFTRPSAAIKKKLVQVANGYYLDKNTSVKDSIKLIEQLANEKIQKNTDIDEE